jgi:hypothetical protein
MTAPPRFFEVPPEDVDERVRQQAARWAARAAAVLDLRALGVTPAIRWFLRGADLKRVRPTRTDLDAFTGPPSLAGLVHSDDPLGTIRLGGHLAPTLAPNELAWYVGHELRHVWQHAQGRPWSRDVEVDVAAEHDAEQFAAAFVAQLKREEMPMSGKWVVLNGRLQLRPETEEARQARLRAWMQKTVGPAGGDEKSAHGLLHPKRVTALVQAAAAATTPGELGRLLTTWTDALDAGELSQTEAETVLDVVEAAHTRLEAKSAPLLPRDAAIPAGGAPRGIEYGDPQPIGRLY